MSVGFVISPNRPDLRQAAVKRPTGAHSRFSPKGDTDPSLVWQSGAGRALLFLAQTQQRLAAGLAGFVDAYGIITYSTYLSFMSGNTTQTGYHIGQGNFATAVAAVLAIVFFVGGSFAGAWLADFAPRRARRLVFGLIAVDQRKRALTARSHDCRVGA
jgi:Protein of unknown function (DUF1275)